MYINNYTLINSGQIGLLTFKSDVIWIRGMEYYVISPYVMIGPHTECNQAYDANDNASNPSTIYKAWYMFLNKYGTGIH